MASAQRLVKRFEITVYKDKSGTDNAQVPALATINFYKQGATVKTATGVISPNDPDPTTVEIYDVGGLAVNDTLGVNTSTNRLIVNAITDSTHILVSATTNTTLAVSDRLVDTSNPPPVYSDPLGTSSSGSSLTTNSTTGRASGYIKQRRFDYFVSGSGLTGRLFIDAEGGLVLAGLAWINALDYPSIQAAVDAVPEYGGVVYVPQAKAPYDHTTTPSYTAPLNLPYDRAIHLLGDGPFRTFLQARSTDNNTDMIKMGGDYQTIEGITLLGPGSVGGGSGSGRGIVIWRTGNYPIPYQADTATSIIYRAHILNCRIQNTSSYGLYIDDAVRNSLPEFGVWAFYDNVEIRNNLSGGGIYVGLNGTTTQYFKNCNIKQFVGYGARLRSAHGVSFIDCIFESGNDRAPYISVENADIAVIEHCWFEGQAFPVVPPGSYGVPEYFFIETTGNIVGLAIDTCLFVRGGGPGSPTQVNPKAILVRSGARSVGIRNPRIGTLGGLPAGGVNHIELESNVEATVEGGTLTDSNGIGVPSVKDTVGASGEKATTLINVMTRIRLPRLTNDQRDALGNRMAGDIFYNVTRDQIQAQIGPSSWRSLLTEAYVRLPGYTTAGRPSVTAGDYGLVIYDTTADRIAYVDNSGTWRTVKPE